MRALIAVTIILCMTPIALAGLVIQSCFNGPAAGLEWMSKLFLGIYLCLGRYFDEEA